MRKIISQTLAVLFLAISITAQTPQANQSAFDDFPNVSLDELLMRFDAFHAELKKNPASSGLVRIYGGAKPNLGFPFNRKALYVAYLVNSGKIEPGRLHIQLCDVSSSEEIRTQHFVVPPGVAVGDCSENFVVPTQTKLIASKLTMINENFESCCEVEGFEKTADKFRDEFIIKLVKSAPDSKIYLIGYRGNAVWEEMIHEGNSWVYKTFKKSDSIRLLNKLLDDAKKSLVGAGVEPAKILTMPGGFKKDVREIEFWFVPKGGEIPKPKPNYLPKKKRGKK